jgi:O-antigen ligase
MLNRLLILWAFSIPFEDLWKTLFTIRTVFKPYRIIGIFIIVGYLLSFLRTKSRFRFDGIDKGFLFIQLSGLGLAFFWNLVADAGRLDDAISEWSLVFFGFAVCVVIKNVINDPRKCRGMYLGFVFGTAASILLTSFLGQRYQGARMLGMFENPNSLGFALAVCVLILIGEAIDASRRRLVSLALWIPMSATLALVLVYTGSRASLLGFGLGFITLLTLVFARQGGRGATRQFLFVFVPVVALSSFLVVTSFEEGGTRTVALQQYFRERGLRKNGGRWDITRAAWDVALDHYLIGIGIGQYPTYHIRYVQGLDNIDDRNAASRELGIHDDYVNLLTNYGWPSLLVYLGMIIYLFRTLLRAGANVIVGRVHCFALPLTCLIFVASVQVTHPFLLSPEYYLLIALICIAARAAKSGYRAT